MLFIVIVNKINWSITLNSVWFLVYYFVSAFLVGKRWLVIVFLVSARQKTKLNQQKQNWKFHGRTLEFLDLLKMGMLLFNLKVWIAVNAFRKNSFEIVKEKMTVYFQKKKITKSLKLFAGPENVIFNDDNNCCCFYCNFWIKSNTVCNKSYDQIFSTDDIIVRCLIQSNEINRNLIAASTTCCWTLFGKSFTYCFNSFVMWLRSIFKNVWLFSLRFF